MLIVYSGLVLSKNRFPIQSGLMPSLCSSAEESCHLMPHLPHILIACSSLGQQTLWFFLRTNDFFFLKEGNI